MSTQHTPGPWSLDMESAGFYVIADNLLVASVQEVDPHPTDIDEYMPAGITEANARLIAAAPDLLAALKACDEAMSYMSEYDIPLTLPAQVRAVIAKATGTTNTQE